MTNARQQLAAAFRSAVFDRITWCSVDDPPSNGRITIVAVDGGKSAPGVFSKGEWTNAKGKPLAFVPTHWADFNDAPE